MKSVKISGSQEHPRVFLCDNGSLVPDAIQALGSVAAALGRKVNREVQAVGLLHSDRAQPVQLGGEPGRVLLSELGKLLSDGEKEFLILPFFLGPSRGVTDWLPKKLDQLRPKWAEARVRVARCLASHEDDRLAQAMSEMVRKVVAKEKLERPFVAMVDHGTPAREVNEVRERVGTQLRELLGDEVAGVRTCSMERRPQPAYDFNEPLLENLLGDSNAFPSGSVVVSQFFLSPGRHAGPDGDVASICREAEKARPGLRTFLTKPLGDHPVVLELLAERLQECLDAC
ncbi:MAG: CbiX/SirB N-terminal domain-containing protein [Opitutales bacterium]